jgi:site-specific DNA-methyltransferase (adenine-specific)
LKLEGFYKMDDLIKKIKGKFPYELIKGQLMICGDCLEVMKNMRDNSVDSIVCDPPYGLSFMGKKWDYDVPKVEIWKECLRVLKHGGHLLAFAGTRTQHRMACNIEDAGFEIKDMIAWIYSSGFPKSLNIGKAIDKTVGNKRSEFSIKGKKFTGSNNNISGKTGEYKITKGNSEWEGWGSSLKPALEPITLARKPLSEKNIASNVLKWGTGGINIDGCRVGSKGGTEKIDTDKCTKSLGKYHDGINGGTVSKINKGRFPANIIHDESEEVLKIFPNSKSSNAIRKNNGKMDNKIYGKYNSKDSFGFNDKGSASRFFYCAKASKQDRNEGLEMLEEKSSRKWRDDKGMKLTGSGNPRNEKSRNFHPTVKPTKLMQYLVRLITPPKGIVFDPFMGSGSTGKACVKEGFGFIGTDLEYDYYNIACKRVKEEARQDVFDF